MAKFVLGDYIMPCPLVVNKLGRSGLTMEGGGVAVVDGFTVVL